MDYINLGIIVLAAVMVWLLYRVTKETRQFIASDKRRVFREVRATGADRPRTATVRIRRS
jgi:hypothetical protein